MKPPRPVILEIPFTTKEEYLAWRTAWRTHYAELSQTIRVLRSLRRTPLYAWQTEEKFKEATATFFNHSKILQTTSLALLEQFKYSVTNVYHKIGKDGSASTITTGVEPVTTQTYYWHGYDTIKLSLRIEAKKLLEMRKNSKVEAQHQYLALKQAKEDRERALARPVEMS